MQEHRKGAPAASGRSRSGAHSSAAARSSAQSIRQDDSPPARAAEGSLGQISAHWPWPSAVGRQKAEVERLDDDGDVQEHKHADDGSCCPPCAERARVPAEERRLRLERLYAQLQLLEMGGRDAAP